MGITREIVRGQSRYWALLCFDCPPYRSLEYRRRLAARPADEILGLDMGPTSQAYVTLDSSGTVVLGEAALTRVRESAARARRIQRALDRSRRAANPDCYDERGRCGRGQRPRTLSARGRRLQAEHTEAARKFAAQRKAATIAQAQEVALLAPRIRVEDQNFRSWQAGGYGRRIAMTSPGLFLQRLVHEQQLSSGIVERLPLRAAFSQHCVCGVRLKKPRSQDWHQCASPLCPIYAVKLDRHLFSAWLMRTTASEGSGGVAGLKEGCLATLLREEPVIQESLQTLCAYSQRGRAKHPEAGDSKARPCRRVSGGVAGRKAQMTQPTLALPVREHARLASALAAADASGNAVMLDSCGMPLSVFADAPAYPR